MAPTCRCRMPSAPCGWCGPMRPASASIRRGWALWDFPLAAMSPTSLATRFAAAVYPPRDEADQNDAKPSFLVALYPVVTMGAGAHEGSRDRLLGPSPTPHRSPPIPMRKTSPPPRRPLSSAWRPTTLSCRRCRMASPFSPRFRRQRCRPNCMSLSRAAMASASARWRVNRVRHGRTCCWPGAAATAFSAFRRRPIFASRMPTPRAAR